MICQDVSRKFAPSRLARRIAVRCIMEVQVLKATGFDAERVPKGYTQPPKVAVPLASGFYIGLLMKQEQRAFDYHLLVHPGYSMFNPIAFDAGAYLDEALQYCRQNKAGRAAKPPGIHSRSWGRPQRRPQRPPPSPPALSRGPRWWRTVQALAEEGVSAGAACLQNWARHAEASVLAMAGDVAHEQSPAGGQQRLLCDLVRDGVQYPSAEASQDGVGVS